MTNYRTEEDPIMRASFTPRRQSGELLVAQWADDINKRERRLITVITSALLLGLAALVLSW